MPELPEVQTVVTGLQSLIGDTITDFWSDWEKVLIDSEGKKISKTVFANKIKGSKIISIERYGKNIFINLSDNLTILAHLRMTGQLLIKNQKSKIKNQNFSNQDQEGKYDKYIHHVFYLKKNGLLAFSDIRKFATLKLIPASQVEIIKHKGGLDPFDGAFTLSYLKDKLTLRKKTIKEFLLDQSIISGIGNIYASEILFDAKIIPSKRSDTLTTSEQKNLYLSVKKILKKAIEMRGTSFSDYRDSAGQKGAFQNMLMVYKRDKQKCKICDTIIVRIVIGGRSTFYCPKCQK